MGDEPLLGQLPLEDMDLIVVPKTREVIPNPASPTRAVLSPRRRPHGCAGVLARISPAG